MFRSYSPVPRAVPSCLVKVKIQMSSNILLNCLVFWPQWDSPPSLPRLGGSLLGMPAQLGTLLSPEIHNQEDRTALSRFAFWASIFFHLPLWISPHFITNQPRLSSAVLCCRLQGLHPMGDELKQAVTSWMTLWLPQNLAVGKSWLVSLNVMAYWRNRDSFSEDGWDIFGRLQNHVWQLKRATTL